MLERDWLDQNTDRSQDVRNVINKTVPEMKVRALQIPIMTLNFTSTMQCETIGGINCFGLMT